MNGNILCDTNFLIFLMDYILFRDPNIRPNNYFVQLDQLLQTICECSVNNKINVTDILFNNEMDLMQNRQVALEKSKFLRRYRQRYIKQQISQIVVKYTYPIPIDISELEKIKSKAEDIYNHPPDENDLSLVVLGLSLSNENNYSSIIITNDEDLRDFITLHIRPLGQFRCDDGNVWSTNKLLEEDMVTFLAYIFRCCKIDDLMEIIRFYYKRSLRQLPTLTFRKQRIKFQLNFKNASDYHEHWEVKQENKESGICV